MNEQPIRNAQTYRRIQGKSPQAYTSSPHKQVEYRNKPHPTFGYNVLNAMFSTIIFVAFYFFYILQLPRDIVQFLLIFAATIISGILGGFIARILTAYYNDIWKTNQFLSKTVIAAFIYTIIVFAGLYGFIMTRYVDFATITVAEFMIYMVSKDFLEIIAVLVAIKLIIFLFSDYAADKMTFGGGS